jgi:hypothetical protein
MVHGMNAFDSQRSERGSAWAIGGASLFALAASSALGHLLFAGPYEHFTPVVSGVVDGLLTSLWLSAAVVLVFRLRGLGLVPVLGVFAAFTHGALYSVAAPLHGLPFVVATPILAAAVWGALRLTHGPNAIPAHR